MKVIFQFQYQEQEICFLKMCQTSQEHVKDTEWGKDGISGAVLETEEGNRLWIALIP